MDDEFARRNLGKALDTLVAVRWYLDKALEDGDEIPDIVKAHMKWANGELHLSIAGLKAFLGSRGLTL